MKKKKQRKKSEPFQSTNNDSLSTLGEALIQENPELVKRMVQIRSSDQVMNRLVRILHDLFPFKWNDPTLFDAGVRLSAQGKAPEAVEALEEALRLNPNAYPAHHLLGYVRGTLGGLKEEIDYYKKALKLNPNYCQLHLDLGRVFWRRGKVKRANFAFKQAALLDQGYETCHDWLSLTFDVLGRYPDNLEPDDRVTRDKNRVLAQMYYMLGTAYIEFGLHPSARYALKEAVRIKPDFPEACYQLGALHIKKLRNPKRAAKYLKRAEDLYIEQNDLQGALLARQVLRLDDPDIDRDQLAEDWMQEGLRLQQLGIYQGAVDACREAIDSKPDLLDAFYNLGIAYGSLHDAGMPRIDKAIHAFKEALKIEPGFKHAYTALGAAYLKQNAFEEAIEILDEGIQVDPDNSVIYYYRGLAFRMSSQFHQAADSLETAIRLNPSFVEAHYSLAMVCFDTMKFTDSCRNLHEAIRLKPDFANGHYMLGILYNSKMPDLDKAATHLKKAEKLYLKLDHHDHAARCRQMLKTLPDKIIIDYQLES